MEMITLMETCDGMLKLEDKELELNSKYSFHVVAMNSVGSVESTPVQISKYYCLSLVLVVVNFLVDQSPHSAGLSCSLTQHLADIIILSIN